MVRSHIPAPYGGRDVHRTFFASLVFVLYGASASGYRIWAAKRFGGEMNRIALCGVREMASVVPLGAAGF